MKLADQGRGTFLDLSRRDVQQRSRRRFRTLAAAMGASLLSSSVALADNYTWTASAGLQSFATPGNWNPSGPPGAIDIPVFALNQSNTVEFSANHSNIALEVLQGNLTFQPDAGGASVERTHSLLIDSFIHGGSLTLAGVSGERNFRMNLAENLFVGGDFFSAGPASGLTLSAGGRMDVGLNLKLWGGSTVTVSGGALHVGTFDHTAGGTFLLNGGSLHAGTFLGNLTNSGGTIAPGASVGTTRITGNLVMSAGAIEIELGGFNPGVDSDRVQVNGSASFGTSQVVIKSLNNFLPLPGDVFEVVTYASATGNPTIINDTGYAGLTFTHQLTANSLALRAQALYDGDADLNGKVDVLDLLALANHWLSSSNWLGGDFDGNGFVDQHDLGLMAQNWQAGVNSLPFEQAIASVGLVPEPGYLIPLLTFLTFGARRRRQSF